MDVMDLRRGLMMGMSSGIIDILRRLNLVKGLNYVRGYINTSGTITPPYSPPNEVSTELIENPFRTSEPYIFIVVHNGTKESNYAGWLGIGYYDANGEWRQRSNPTVVKSEQVNEEYWIDLFPSFIPLYSDGSVIISSRTYGDAEIFLCSVKDLMTEVFASYRITEHVVFSDVPTA